jgi:glycosyltransferase involved in cell wall biosynthesis
MNEQPFVSVIMPVRNEEPFIARSLSCVLAQDYPRDRIEIIVSDGMSTDGTRETIRRLQQQRPNLHLIDNVGKIAPTGLNAALRQARGDVVIRVDGHCEIARDYASQCVKHLFREHADAVGGPIETIGCTAAIALAMSSGFGVGGTAFRTVKDRTMLVDTVAFPAYTRAAIEKTGQFDEEMVRNQDDEYNYRLRKLGGRILLSPTIRSRYYSRPSLRSLWRQYYQYGYWKVRVLQKHPFQMSWRQFVPPLFVAALVLSSIAALFSSAGRALVGLVAGSYLLANLAASFLVAGRNSWKALPQLPVIFAILHLSYGLGFLVGLLRFRKLWGKPQAKQVTVNPWRKEKA